MFAWLNPLNKALDIVDSAVIDQDKKIALKHQLAAIREQVYTVELQTQTIPWVDALHKMGRQIISLSQLIFYGVVLYLQVDITPEIVAGVSGPASVYTYIKGQGR